MDRFGSRRSGGLTPRGRAGPFPRRGSRVGRVLLFHLLAAALAGLTPAFAQPLTTVSGTTTTLSGDVFLPNVSIVVTRASDGEVAAETVSDGLGRFTLPGLPEGAFVIAASLPGFAEVRRAVTVPSGKALQIDFDLPVAGVEETVDVAASRPANAPLEIPRTATSAGALEGALVDTAPVRGESIEGLLPLLPGVVRAADGRLSVKGGTATQTSLLVNSISVSDPVTGEFGITLPSDAVDSVTLLPNPYSAEYGRFSAGVSDVQTRRGTDRWRFALNNFLPRLRFRDSQVRGIEKFTPRVAIGGPLKKGTVHLAQSLRYRLVKTKVPARPEIENDSRLQSVDSFTQIDANLTTRHHLTATASLFPRRIDLINLDTFTPRETTFDLRQRGFNLAVSERAILSPAALLETTAAFKRFDLDIFGQGTQPMVLAPEVNRGNVFNEQERRTRTAQVAEALILQRQGWSGEHLFKVGIDLLHSSFDGRSVSRPVEVRRADDTLSQRIEYGSPGVYEASSLDLGGFLQDRWRPADRWVLELGARLDRDGVIERANLSPRAGVVFDVRPDGTSVLKGGVGRFFSQTPLNVAVFERHETATVTRFGADGTTPVAAPARYRHSSAVERTPSSVVWNVEYDRKVRDSVLLRVNHLRRIGRNEFIVRPIETAGEAVLRLDSNGRSRYWEVEVTSRVVVRTHEMHFTYVHSRSRADLNAYDGFFGNFRNPIIRPNEFSRTENDTAHRFLFRGAFAVGGWAVSPVLEVRQGFPFSLVDENRDFVGPRNQGGRFPVVRVLDLDVQRRVKIGGLTTRIGLRVFNLFDAYTPRDVQNNVDATSFGRFSNPIERTFGLTFQIER